MTIADRATCWARPGTLLPDVVELRRTLHRHPELGLDLPRTQAAVLDALDGLGLDITVGERAELGRGGPGRRSPGPTILLRGDMDALPDDRGHRPGLRQRDRRHDARVRPRRPHRDARRAPPACWPARRDELPGRVRFMFQPGEEGSGGAALMIDDGVLDGVDARVRHPRRTEPAGRHASPGSPGAALASADEFEIIVTGRGGHASTPHWATDPVPGRVRDGPGAPVDDHPHRRRVRPGGADGRPGRRRDRPTTSSPRPPA